MSHCDCGALRCCLYELKWRNCFSHKDIVLDVEPKTDQRQNWSRWHEFSCFNNNIYFSPHIYINTYVIWLCISQYLWRHVQIQNIHLPNFGPTSSVTNKQSYLPVLRSSPLMNPLLLKSDFDILPLTSVQTQHMLQTCCFPLSWLAGQDFWQKNYSMTWQTHTS